MTPTRLAEIEAEIEAFVKAPLGDKRIAALSRKDLHKRTRNALRELLAVARTLESDLAKANTKIGEQEACYDQHERLEADNARLTRELAEAKRGWQADEKAGMEREAALEKERDAARAQLKRTADSWQEEATRLAKERDMNIAAYEREVRVSDEARAEAEAWERERNAAIAGCDKWRGEAEALSEAVCRHFGCKLSWHADDCRALKALTAGSAETGCTCVPGVEATYCEKHPNGPAAEPPAKCGYCDGDGTYVEGKTGTRVKCPMASMHAPPKPEPRAEELVCPDYKHTWEQCPIRKHGFGLWPASQGGK